MASHSLKLVRRMSGGGAPKPSLSDGEPSTPLSVWMLVSAGYVAASAMMLVGLSADVIPGAKGVVGTEFVSSPTFDAWGIALVGSAFLAFLACVFVWMGQLYGVVALVAAGTAGSLVLVVIESWVSVVTVGATIVVVAMFVLGPALDHFVADDIGIQDQ